MTRGRPRTVDREIHPLFDRLREERIQQGLSQTMVAQRMGNTTANAVSKLERGVNPGVKISTLENWAHALGYEMTFQLEAMFEVD